jgi:hypothetical protein
MRREDHEVALPDVRPAPRVGATRLIASVALRVKIVCPGVEPANAADFARAPS